MVLDFLAVDNFDFTRKIGKKNWVKNSSKCWGFVKIDFLDENLTFGTVCNEGLLIILSPVLIRFQITSKNNRMNGSEPDSGQHGLHGL